MGKIEDNEVNRRKKFGNNYFTLTTPGSTVLRGVLTELPPFSISTSWTESPASSISDEVMKLINKPEFEFLASNKNAATVMRRMGNMTSKVYENAEPVSLELKFRCYANQHFGDDENLSTAKEWVDGLKESIISTKANVNLTSAINNVKGAIDGAASQIFGIIDDIKKLGETEDQDDTNAKGLTEAGRRKKRMNEKLNRVDMKKFKDDARVAASKDNYGAALYKLKIFPFLFRDPLIVYVSNWSMKPSKEYSIDKDTNFYFDFTVTCTMDQIPDGNTWDQITYGKWY